MDTCYLRAATGLWASLDRFSKLVCQQSCRRFAGEFDWAEKGGSLKCLLLANCGKRRWQVPRELLAWTHADVGILCSPIAWVNRPNMGGHGRRHGWECGHDVSVDRSWIVWEDLCGGYLLCFMRSCSAESDQSRLA